MHDVKTNAVAEREKLLSLLDRLLDDLWIGGVVRFACCVDLDYGCLLLRRGWFLGDGSLLDCFDGDLLRRTVKQTRQRRFEEGKGETNGFFFFDEATLESSLSCSSSSSSSSDCRSQNVSQSFARTDRIRD